MLDDNKCKDSWNDEKKRIMHKAQSKYKTWTMLNINSFVNGTRIWIRNADSFWV